MMKIPDFKSSYDKHVARLLEGTPEHRAMSDAVGGDFQAVGQVEHALLLQLGLESSHTIVDAGCGSGRLAVQLKDTHKGCYIGFDVVDTLYKYAAKICGRPDWRFYRAPGLEISEPDLTADFVCFFSVFTHLLHEEAFLYLCEAERVLKPGGKVVISFLEFRISAHWETFAQSVKDRRDDKVLTQFVSREGLAALASHAGLTVHHFLDGDKPLIGLVEDVKWDNGHIMRGYGGLGQSICVLTKI